MKKLTAEYRELQLKRNRQKLLKKKMSTFTNVKFQKGVNPVVWDVKVKILQGVILFEANNFRDYLEHIDIAAFDDELEAALILVLNDPDTIALEFQNQQQKENFVTLLKAFLGFR